MKGTMAHNMTTMASRIGAVLQAAAGSIVGVAPLLLTGKDPLNPWGTRAIPYYAIGLANILVTLVVPFQNRQLEIRIAVALLSIPCLLLVVGRWFLGANLVFATAALSYFGALLLGRTRNERHSTEKP